MSRYISVIQKKKEIVAILNSFNCTEPKLFGSTARKEDTEESDIDILFTPREGATGFGIVRAERMLSSLLGGRVELTDSTTLKDLFKPYVEKDLISLN